MARFRFVHSSRNFSHIRANNEWVCGLNRNSLRKSKLFNIVRVLSTFLHFNVHNIHLHICGKLRCVDRRRKYDSGKTAHSHICISSQQPMHVKEWIPQMLPRCIPIMEEPKSFSSMDNKFSITSIHYITKFSAAGNWCEKWKCDDERRGKQGVNKWHFL